MIKGVKSKLIIFELIIIIILFVLLYLLYNKTQNINNRYTLISPRISAGVLEPKSYLILNFKPLENKINNWIKVNNLNISAYVLNLRDGASFGINENRLYNPVSFSKLPLAIIILKKSEMGELNLDDLLSIDSEDRDSDSGPVFSMRETSFSIKQLIYYMLAYSDNTAYWTLLKKTSTRDFQHLSNYLDYYSWENSSGLPNNMKGISPKSTANIFTSLYLSTVLNPDNSEFIISCLVNNSLNVNLMANIPKEVVLAHKNGESFSDAKNYLFHDCGIIYVQDSRLFYCIMTRDLNEDDAHKVVGILINGVYNYILTGKMNEAQVFSI